MRLRAAAEIGCLLSDGRIPSEIQELLDCMSNTQQQLEACQGLAPTYQARVVPLLLADFAGAQKTFVRRYYVEAGRLLT